MSESLDLYEAEGLYKACKRFVETWEFGKECNNRKGMYTFLEGIERDLKNQKDDIIHELSITSCPFQQGEK